MSHEEIVFNGKNFVENVLRYAVGNDPVVGTADIAQVVDEARTNIDTAIKTLVELEDYLSSFNTENKPFSSWSVFFEGISGGDAAIKESVIDIFVEAYRTILNMGSGGPDDPITGSDWADLVNALDQLSPSIEINAASEFINSFEDFLFSYQYNSSGGVTDATEFFDNWASHMTVTAQLRSDTSTEVPISYQEVYESFGFPPSEFGARLAEFYLERTDVSQGGSPYFIPSHNFDEWFEEMRSDYIKQNFVSSVDTGTSSELLVIDRILRLLVTLIDILQRVSVVQANRLGFLTNWQRAYTDQLAQIPQFLEGDGSPLSPPDFNDLGDDEQNEIRTFRSDANTRMQAITTKIQAWRGAVQDQAKGVQSTINQSQDAANQQTQMATSLLQQLSTILSQIFR